MTNGTRQPMATWLKFVIAIVIIGLLAGTAMLVAGGVFVASKMQQSLDPSAKAKVLDSIVKMENPLPDGFTCISAVDMMGSTEATFLNKKRTLTVILVKLPKNNYKISSQRLLQIYLDNGDGASGLPPALASLKSRLEVEKRGTMTVGGEEMAYAIAKKTVAQKTVPLMVGYVVPPSTNQTVMFMGQSIRQAEFDKDEMMRFLGAVKGF